MKRKFIAKLASTLGLVAASAFSAGAAEPVMFNFATGGTAGIY